MTEQLMMQHQYVDGIFSAHVVVHAPGTAYALSTIGHVGIDDIQIAE